MTACWTHERAYLARMPSISPTPLRPIAPRPDSRDGQQNPRLRVQEKGLRTRNRHLLRATRRIGVLAALDGACLLGAQKLLQWVRTAPLSAELSELVFPLGFMGGWGTVAAFIVGLGFAGAYSSEERWASTDAIARGTGIGAALGLWQSIDQIGITVALSRWAALTLCVVVLLVAVRKALLRAVSRYRHSRPPSERVLFVGEFDSLVSRRVLEAITGRPGTLSLGWLSEHGDSRDYLGHPSAVWEVLSTSQADTVVLSGEISSGVFDSVVEAAMVAGCKVFTVRSRATLMSSRPQRLRTGDVRALELTFPASRAGQDGLKRLFDLVASTTMLILASPVLLATAALIKFDTPGPILFKQERVGYAGRVFRMWKFRTMTDGADALKQDLAHLNTTGDPRLFKIPNDPRVTRVGAVLRKWSLDELPQLWNVVRGEMSLVGPRPFFEADLADYDDHHFTRLAVKPGVTGLWQVKGRSSIVDFEEVVELDREYVETWSLALDVWILLATIPAVFRRTGAF